LRDIEKLKLEKKLLINPETKNVAFQSFMNEVDYNLKSNCYFMGASIFVALVLLGLLLKNFFYFLPGTLHCGTGGFANMIFVVCFELISLCYTFGLVTR